MSEPTWEDGPWLVEVRSRYVVKGCTSDEAVRAVRALENGMPMAHDETMPDVSESVRTITIHPEGDTPFPDDWFNEGEQR